MGTAGIFTIFFAVFGFVVVVVGWITRKWIGRSTDYLVAGRQINLLVNILGVAAIGYAGTTLTLAPAFTLMGGLVKSIFMLGVAYSLTGIISYAFLIAPVARRTGAHTLPEWLEVRYNSKVRFVITLITIVAMLGITANNVLSMATIISGFTGWSVQITILITFAIFMFFTVLGGMWAVTLTDFIQGVLCTIAMPLLLVYLFVKYGGLSFVAKNWPSGSFWTTGIAGKTFPWFSISYPSVLVAFFLYGMALVWGSNSYWIRVSSVRSERVAKYSYLWAAVILFLANGFMYPLLGAYVGATNPGAFVPRGSAAPAAAFGIFLKAAPPVLAAYFLLTTMAASVSTATTYYMAGSSVIVRDLYQRFFKPNAKPEQLVKPSMLFNTIFGVASLLLCFFPGGPVYLFAFATAWLAPVAVIVILGFYSRRFSATGAFAGGLVGLIFMSVWTLLDLTKIYPLSTKVGHMVIPGLIVSFAAAIVANFFGKSKYEIIVQKRDKLTDEELKVLELIYKGYNTMAEITDLLDVDSSKSSDLVLSLEKAGVIERLGNRGMNFYTFKVTEFGKNILMRAKKIETAEIDEVGLSLLEHVKEGKPILADELSKKTGLNPMGLAMVINSLVRRGYLKEGGLWRRKISITEKGLEVLSRLKS
jgi:SSS family solute:Na+ symporter